MIRDSYVIHEVKLNEEEVNHILIGAVGANHRLSTVRFPTEDDPDHYYKAVVTEKFMLSFYDPDPKKAALDEGYIASVLGQLDVLAGSDRNEKILAGRAAEIIRALLAKNGESE